MAVKILSPQERERLSTIPLEITDAELVRFFTLQKTAFALFDPRVSPSHHLDQAAHVCLLRWLGWSPVCVNRLPRPALVALCEQLRMSVPDDLEPPPPRTSRLHAQRAREHLGWRKCTADVERSLASWLKSLAEEHDQGSVLLNAMLRHLYQEKVARPGLTRLERLIETARVTARDEIVQAINSQLTQEQKKLLDELVTVSVDETRSPLQRFKETPPKATRPHLRAVLEKIRTIHAIGLDRLDLSSVHPNRVKLMAQRTRRRENWSTARLKPDHRYPLLVCFLDQTLPILLDQAVQMHGKAVQNIFYQSEKKRDEQVAQRGRILNDKVLLLAQLVRLILDEKSVPDDKLRTTIYGCVPREQLTHTARECDEIAQPADYTPLMFAENHYSHLRSFGPHFLRTLNLQAKDADTPLMKAMSFIQAVDEEERGFDDPPLEFVPWQWKTYVEGEKEDSVNRHMYELCLHDCVAKALKRGELWIADSKTYANFRNDWISDDDWPTARKAFLAKYPHLADVDTFLEQARETLDAQMAAANSVWPDLQDQGMVEIDEDGTLHLERLKAQESSPGDTRLQDHLTRLFPRIDIAQLLLEVNHWIGVDRLLTNLNPHEHPPENLAAKKIAVIMAEGLNIGLQNMSKSVPTMTYRDLAGIYDRYIREDTLRQAIVAVVNLISHSHCTSYNGLVIMV